MVGVRVQVRERFLSSPQRSERSGTHPASYPTGTEGSFPGGEAAAPKSKIHGSIHPLPHTLSWLSASLVKHKDKFNFIYCNVYSWCYATNSRKNMRCLVMARKHVNNIRAIARQLLGKRVLAATNTHATVEVLLVYNNGSGVLSVVRAQM
jgi:hypothetical protein